jgi:hypothetical protein
LRSSSGFARNDTAKNNFRITRVSRWLPAPDGAVAALRRAHPAALAAAGAMSLRSILRAAFRAGCLPSFGSALCAFCLRPGAALVPRFAPGWYRFGPLALNATGNEFRQSHFGIALREAFRFARFGAKRGRLRYFYLPRCLLKPATTRSVSRFSALAFRSCRLSWACLPLPTPISTLTRCPFQ